MLGMLVKGSHIWNKLQYTITMFTRGFNKRFHNKHHNRHRHKHRNTGYRRVHTHHFGQLSQRYHYWIPASLAIAGSLVAGCAMNGRVDAWNVGKRNFDTQELHALVSDGSLKDVTSYFSSYTDDEIREALNTRHPVGWFPIHAAVIHGKLDIVEWMLQHGADINAIDVYYPRSMESIQKRSLFSKRFNPRTDCRGWTPLHYAISFGYVDITKYLLEHGADETIPNLKGYLPSVYNDLSEESGRIISSLLDDMKDLRRHQDKLERAKYPLEERISKVMVGQKNPIHAVSSAIRRKQNGWHDEDKPLVLMFLGSSGVGKTMLAKCVAEHVSKDPENGFIRIDMTEYTHTHEVSKFIGAPPGYVGYEEGGQLTERLKKCPNAVVLLDEVEKAHPDVLTIMLQVFDEGRLTDGKGNTIDCKDATFIMTSNLVQDEIHKTGYTIRYDGTNSSVVQDHTQKFVRETVQPILKEHFKRDEFLGRINDFVIFHPFSDKDLNDIVTLELDKWKTRALKRHNIGITWDNDVENSLTSGFNYSYGFRSIKHEVEKRVINQLAAAYEQDNIKEGDNVKLSLDSDGYTILWNK
eukprot:TRINITY_DN7313_c0_g1_i1.p1 TRINITY_DN7313_c0_g1~~TRINITY_DN7313_c0_g1_i1.p1  ORF type:complete len:580 (+),score=120.85 TRINITY_DN7313_c0_g1_i1:260-1999(+)